MWEVPDWRCAHALPAAIGTPPPTIALVPSAPASNHCRCIEPPRPAQYPCASPRISASVRCSTSCISAVTSCLRSSAPLVTWVRALARNWWCPRCEPLTASVERSPTIEPTAPPSWPMLEGAGPCTSPAPASSRTVSSNARMRCNCPSTAPSNPGSAAFQSAAVVLSSFHSTPGATRFTRGPGTSLRRLRRPATPRMHPFQPINGPYPPSQRPCPPSIGYIRPLTPPHRPRPYPAVRHRGAAWLGPAAPSPRRQAGASRWQQPPHPHHVHGTDANEPHRG